MKSKNQSILRRRRPQLLAVMSGIILFAILLVATQCSRPTPQQLPVVRLNIVTWPGYGPIYLAKNKGFFKEEGIEVDCQIQENTQARHSALISGEIDLIGITLESVILASAQGIPMQVIGVTDISNGGDGIVARKEINSIADLKGKRVAFPEGQPSHLFLLYQLNKAGLSVGDIKPVFTDDAGKAGELFAAGQVDAAVTWEPWLSQVVKTGKGQVLVDSKGVKDILVGILAGHRDRIPAETDKLQRFLRGWYRGLQYASEHPDESIPIMADGFQLPPEEFKSIMQGLRFISKDEAKSMLGADGSKGSFYDITQYEGQLWQKAKVMQNPVDPDLVYTNRIISGVK